MPDTAALTARVEDDLDEVQTSAGLLRYYDVGNGPVLLFLHGSGRRILAQLLAAITGSIPSSVWFTCWSGK